MSLECVKVPSSCYPSFFAVVQIQMLIDLLLYTKHCSRAEAIDVNRTNKALCPHGAYSLVGESTNYIFELVVSPLDCIVS